MYIRIRRRNHPSNPAWLSSCSLSRSSSASPGCRLLRSPSLSGHFCRMSGKSVLSVWPWLSSDSTSRWIPLHLAKSSRYRATSGLSPYRTCAHRAHISRAASANTDAAFFVYPRYDYNTAILIYTSYRPDKCKDYCHFFLSQQNILSNIFY